jgi:hypothetical protein
MLTFGVFEADSGYEEIAERISKFRNFHEITALEDNFPFKLCDTALFNKLINEAEVVFDPYSLQIVQVVESLTNASGQDEP